MALKRTLIFLTLAIVTISMLAVTGCFRHSSFEDRIADKVDHISWFLDLNDQQQAKLIEVKDEILLIRDEHRSKFQELLSELNTQIQRDQLDQDRVLTLIEEVQTMRSLAAPQVVAKLAEFHATLTPEQKNKAVRHLQRFQEMVTQSST